MKILVIGSNGQLGSQFRALSQNHPDFEWIFKDKNQFNLTHLNNLESNLDLISPKIILNFGAYTNVENAESKRNLSNTVNHLAVSILARWSFINEVKLIHMSTDYVYPGDIRKPLNELDITNPLNYYGITKLLGENECQLNNPNSIIIRTSGNFSIFGNNFVKMILKKMGTTKTLNVVSDQIFSPTYVEDLALAIISILKHKSWLPGLYNYSNSGSTSWYQFAIDIRSIAGFETVINPISSLDYASKAKRPKYSFLDSSKIEKTFNIFIPNYKLGLEKCVKNLRYEK